LFISKIYFIFDQDFNPNRNTMRNAVLRWLLIVAGLLFIDWLIMIILGCFSGLCQASTRYFCSVYCKIGIVLLSLSALLIGWLAVRKFFPKREKSS
jgi:hypothetical protein